MTTCDMGYQHEGPAAPAAPEPEVILTTPPTNEHDVAIAEARAAANVAETKAYADARDPEAQAEIARLQGELDGMRATLAALQPPEPVSEPKPAPEPAVTVVEAPGEPEPPENPTPPEPKKPKKAGFWDNYS